VKGASAIVFVQTAPEKRRRSQTRTWRSGPPRDHQSAVRRLRRLFGAIERIRVEP